MQGRVLSLDEFVALTARLDAGLPTERVLAEAELTPEAWLEAQKTWLERMARLAAKGRPQLHERFLAQLEEHRAKLAQEATGPVVGGPLPRPPEPVLAAIVRSRPARRRPKPAVAAALPFAARASALPPSAPPPAPPSPAAPPSPPRRAATAAFAAVPVAAAIPFASSETAPAPASTKGDAALPFSRASPAGGDALPFRSSSSQPATARVAAPSRSRDGLPFRPAGAGQTAPAPPADVARASGVVAMPAGAAAPPRVKRQTLGIEAISPADLAALPFAAGAKSSAPRGKQEGALPFAQPRRSRPDETVPCDQPVVSEESLEMTVEQYAWLCAALTQAPDQAAATLGWMRLTAERKAELDRGFESLFRDDAEARARFFRAMAGHRPK